MIRAYGCVFLYVRIRLSVNNKKSSPLLVNSIFPFGLSVNWAHTNEFAPLNANMQDWLLDTGSLTERLQSLSSHFELELLGQKPLPLESSEKRALPNHQLQTWQIREVILYGNGKPWVFARSVLPDHLCNSTWANLGKQPLGQRIFNDPSFVRSDFEIGHLQQHPLTHKSFYNTTANAANAKRMVRPELRWARRSVFTRGADTLLVAEAFLPDCPCYGDKR
jgi:chorismate--pyruvate lyase